MARVIDHTAAFAGALKEKLADNLTDAILHFNEELKDKISIQGPPRSTPGNPPHRDTGDLIDSIRHEVDEDALVAKSGSDLPYALTLELSMDRAYWVPTFVENADEIARRVLKP